VDFAKDAQWIAWNEEAIGRFMMDRQKMTSTNTALLNLESNPIMATSKLPQVQKIPESWYQPSNGLPAPLLPCYYNGDAEQSAFETESIYESCTQIVALDDNVKDDLWSSPGMVRRENIM
jgi:hypothetical protein